MSKPAANESGSETRKPHVRFIVLGALIGALLTSAISFNTSVYSATLQFIEPALSSSNCSASSGEDFTGGFVAEAFSRAFVE